MAFLLVLLTNATSTCSKSIRDFFFLTAKLLVEEGIVWSVTVTLANGGVGNDIAQLARLDITLDDNHAVVVLGGRGNQRTGLVERETTGVAAASRGRLHEGEVARLLVDGEGHDGVRRQGRLVGGVEVGDGQQVLATRGDEDEFLVGLLRAEKSSVSLSTTSLLSEIDWGLGLRI